MTKGTYSAVAVFSIDRDSDETLTKYATVTGREPRDAVDLAVEAVPQTGDIWRTNVWAGTVEEEPTPGENRNL